LKIKRQELVDALTVVRPALAQRAINPQTTHFVFNKEHLIAYNDRIAILYPFKTDFQCSVAAEELYKILTGISLEEIVLSFKDDKIHIHGKGFNAGLATETGDAVLDLVAVLKIDKAKKNKLSLPEDFIEAITMCMFSASKDVSNPAMTCLLIEDKYVASTDDLRISEYKMKGEFKETILLPASSAIDLSSYKVTEYSIAPDKQWAFFFGDNGVIFCSRLVNAEFPDYVPFMEGFDDNEIQLPKETRSMVEISSILTEGESIVDKEVTIEFGNGQMTIRGKNEKGWIENEVETGWKSDAVVQFAINPFFMLKILDHTTSMYYGEGKALFKSGEFHHVIALRVLEE